MTLGAHPGRITGGDEGFHRRSGVRPDGVQSLNLRRRFLGRAGGTRVFTTGCSCYDRRPVEPAEIIMFLPPVPERTRALPYDPAVIRLAPSGYRMNRER
jgi:hypothetical protein